jgi:transcription initiation factor TFIIF subunit alpha
MSARDFDPEQLAKPILMNRKQPGPRELPVHALDDDGKIVGKYMYDDAGKPMLAPNGQPIIEKKDVGLDPDLIGGVPGQKRKLKKGVKEVFHQDLSVIRMKREEATPWVLETGRPRPEGQTQTLGHVPEHWVGRMTEASSLPTVLLINDGRLESGFEVVPLGRTYRFTPERPFKTLDADAANKLVCPAVEAGFQEAKMPVRTPDEAQGS